MKYNIYFIFVLLLSLVINPPVASSQKIVISSHKYLPPLFFAVDKKKERLYLLNYNNTLTIIAKEPCSTGTRQGDKFIRGDHKTPEGIYFITRKIKRPLNYSLYGNLAYAMNYPNPVDRLFDKDGGGIWLHGRGKKLKPYDTKGCVAIKTDTLKKLSGRIQKQITPILIGSEIVFKPKDKDILKEVNAIHKRVEKWSRAWKDKNPIFFTFYDPLSFSKSTRFPFKKFIAKKRHYFSKYKWIDIFIPKIFILKGPYYYVSYFFQLYRSPNFISTGLKRLYWMKIHGKYKIVASEWIKLPVDLKSRYLVYHTNNILKFLKKWKSAWEKKDINRYKNMYDKKAVQGKYVGIDSIIAHKKKIWKKCPNIEISIKRINISMCKDGFKIVFLQEYKSSFHKDTGKKRIIIYPYKNSYKILREEWLPI